MLARQLGAPVVTEATAARCKRVDVAAARRRAAEAAMRRVPPPKRKVAHAKRPDGAEPEGGPISQG